MITLVGLQRKLLVRLDHLVLHLLDLTRKHSLSRCSRVNTIGLDGNQDVTTVLEEVVSVETDDSSLVRLSNISEDDVNHSDEHSVLVRVSSVLNDSYERQREHNITISTRLCGELSTTKAD